MQFLVPLYVALLLEPTSLQSASKPIKQIHEHLLSHVTQVGPKYPEVFRSIMQTSPELNQRLKAALQARQSDGPRVSESGRKTQQAPAIKLKMNFSNFN